MIFFTHHFFAAGVLPVVNGISNAEGALNADMAAAGSDEVAQQRATNKFVTTIQDLMSKVTPTSLIIIGIWVAVLLIGCFLGVFFLIRFGYTITEESHRQMVDELEKRHAAVGFDTEELAQPEQKAE